VCCFSEENNAVTNLKQAHYTGSSDTESTIETAQDEEILVWLERMKRPPARMIKMKKVSAWSLTERRIGPHKCGEFVLNIVRVAVRHRPGTTLLHDRMSDQVRPRTLTMLAF